MNQHAPDEETLQIDLRNPGTAAFLAWLWPGAGHLYQRRYAKGLLFMTCILGAFFFGLYISGGRAVYASWTRQDFRWQYICQLGVGAPALPAVIQERIVMGGDRPMLPICYRYPATQPATDKVHAFDVVSPEVYNSLNDAQKSELIVDGFMAPPHQPVREESPDVLAAWHEELPTAFEMGTLFTMIAGLLNVLAIYDAYAGPVIAVPEDEEPKKPPSGEGSAENSGEKDAT